LVKFPKSGICNPLPISSAAGNSLSAACISLMVLQIRPERTQSNPKIRGSAAVSQTSRSNVKPPRHLKSGSNRVHRATRSAYCLLNSVSWLLSAKFFWKNEAKLGPSLLSFFKKQSQTEPKSNPNNANILAF
jgi:hypothetical protein